MEDFQRIIDEVERERKEMLLWEQNLAQRQQELLERLRSVIPVYTCRETGKSVAFQPGRSNSYVTLDVLLGDRSDPVAMIRLTKDGFTISFCEISPEELPPLTFDQVFEALKDKYYKAAVEKAMR